jgi:hypothetical protein
VKRIHSRDTASYFGVLLDNNNRKPICRLRFNFKQKYISLIDKEKNEERIPIEDLNDIYGISDRIRETVALYEPAKVSSTA